ncbi:hypothetical protein KFK09_004449 [Dendrobium nobile]|uniref:Uncharacterized protein n=1 Tax=Dendrobium nobile TaxID=94219 RepID=A0A8T3C0Q1_DENNO|nr:hypothetical protein KFK09_004449 [Dendrobium nobile]
MFIAAFFHSSDITMTFLLHIVSFVWNMIVLINWVVLLLRTSSQFLQLVGSAGDPPLPWVGALCT